MQKLNNLFRGLLRQPRWRLVSALVVVGGIAALLWSGGGKTGGKIPNFAARRGPLEITVLEGGSLQALESQEIKCEVRVGYQGTKILKIVEEGYFVSEADVKTNKVLVELDSSDLQKQIVQQEIQYQSAAANLTDSQQNYEIQLGQNKSDIAAAEQKARFARLDLDKFLGDTVTAQIVEQVGLDKLLVAASTNNVEQTSSAEELSSHPSEPRGGSAAELVIPGTLPGVNLQPAVLRTVSTNPVASTGPSTAQKVFSQTDRSPNVRGPSSSESPSKEDKTQKTLSHETTTGSKAAIVADGVVITDPPSASPPANISSSPPRQNPEQSSPTAATNSQPAEENHAENSKALAVDFSQYAHIEALGDGEAKQKLRKFDDDLQVARKELEQAKAKLEGTRRLFDKGFVTKTELQQDEIAFENSRLKVQTADTARDLFLKYDFLKSAEESLSKFAEAVREFDKARRVAVSKLAQAKAKLTSAQGQYQVQSRQLKDLNEQLEKCTVRAKKTGLVVYGGSRDEMVYYGGEERIREGATVRERQAIITIPDMTRMSVNVKIHESYIKKVKKGQKARITVDAFPDTVLTGEVTKLGVLPDSANRWMNPDLKVYLTTITIDGTYDWVKPGMSAKVEILVNKLDNCVYVPVQAVVPENGKQVCYVANGFNHERREIETGEFNDEFIQVKNGIKEGERVLLRAPGAPETAEPAKSNKDQKASENEKKPEKTAPATGPGPATVSKA